jgi:hypothetical protein
VLLLALVPVPFLGWVGPTPRTEPRPPAPTPTTPVTAPAPPAEDLDAAIRRLRQDVERLEKEMARP